MGTSSINSAFNFISYKVDNFSFTMKKEIGLLELNGIPLSDGALNVGIRPPVFFKKTNKYVCGIDCMLLLHQNEIQKENRTEENALIVVKCGIAGSFQLIGEIEKETEESIIKIQAPALLMPYLRGTVSSFIANSGFGSFIFPLINIHTLAKQTLSDKEIQVIEQ